MTNSYLENKKTLAFGRTLDNVYYNNPGSYYHITKSMISQKYNKIHTKHESVSEH